MRRYSTILAGVLAGVLALSGFSFAAAGPAMAGGCPSFATFAVGGTGDPESTHTPRVPVGWRENIAYPADVFQGDKSRKIARDKLSRAARHMRAVCPATHIHVVGYSLGASAASVVVDHWQSDPVMSRRTSATFVGNPRRPIGPTGWGGIETAGLPHIPGVYTWSGARRGGPIPVVEVCNEGRDVICSVPVPMHRNLVGAWESLYGYLTGDHLY
ncbi:serine hydrolase [Gordonia phage Splinter]|uniref:Serine hydrolase n=2 Tax=Vendettavirus vendetta TaxID=2049886 RepID=A0A166Y3X2_9CAUD|nr:serine hydrolase [Gordonia phage Vendetta]YP_009275360.1 serine hydrolase [Gordonia phage Splinter]ANA85553.1 serine hydrolase [Gordonia phage Vendetta]ANA85632.1 serine hydrolase [Gordonia phage Splinter]